MKRVHVRGGEASLLIASGILVVYGAVMALFSFFAAVAIGLTPSNSPLEEPSSIFNSMWLFVAIHMFYIVLGITLHRGLRPLYFLTIGVVVVMFLWHYSTTLRPYEPVPLIVAAPFMVVNLLVLLFLGFGYKEVESGTVRKPVWRILHERRSPGNVRCRHCGSRSVQVLSPGKARCSLCGNVISL